MKRAGEEITLFAGVFSVLFVLSFSFPFQVLPDIGGVFEPAFNKLVQLIVSIGGVEVAEYHSGEDATGMLLNTINVLVLSVLGYLGGTLKAGDIAKQKLITWSKVWIRYYLALILLIYGFDKVYKWQFYAPESNILYTRVKDIPQDMLYWTTMGTSYSYSLFGGLLEVLAGLLLLFRKTTLLGALLAFGVLANVFAVNLGFDITVKIFSGFLTSLSIVLVFPFLQPILLFFSGETVRLDQQVPAYARSRYYPWVKAVILLLFLIESHYKYVAAGNFNDDHAPRPHFCGVYHVVSPSEGTIVNLHFHRHGYLILQMEDDQMMDYQLEVNEGGQQFLLTDYSFNKIELNYQEKGDTLLIESPDKSFSLIAVKGEL
jgi:uncharacterized membrane protein YphA (DoxX/SURF4 family)